MLGAGGKRSGARQKPQQKKKGKRGSGNPAKRAAAAVEAPPKDGAGSFGFGQDAGEVDFEIPKELRDLM